MRIVATGHQFQERERFTIWELPPIRRTIVAVTRWSSNHRFFIPFPYVYMIIGHTEVSGIKANWLRVAFRPNPISSEDRRLYFFDIPNSDNGVVCLGHGLRYLGHTPDIKILAEKMIELYFSSTFMGLPEVKIPVGEEEYVKSFDQWSKFKKFQEMSIDWSRTNLFSSLDSFTIDWGEI